MLVTLLYNRALLYERTYVADCMRLGNEAVQRALRLSQGTALSFFEVEKMLTCGRSTELE